MTTSVIHALTGRLDAAIADQAQYLDPLAKAVQGRIASAVGQTGPLGQKLKDVLHGVWLGHALHPVLTDVPIGAWTAGVLFDLVGEESGADAAFTFGALAAVPTAMSGTADWLEITDEPRRLGFVHAVLNAGALALILGSLRARATGSRGLGICLSTAGYALSASSAWLGGELVYRLGTGVTHSAFDPPLADFQPCADVASLREGELTGGVVQVDGQNLGVVLLKRGSTVLALGGVCSHAGGPLAEGKLVDGNCVECPWHGSRFSMEDGQVLHGPASIPQPVLETRLRGDKVEVRRRAP